MSHPPLTRLPTLFLLSGLLTLVFIGCAGKTQVLNAMDAGAGGHEDEGFAPGSGGSGAAAKAGAYNQAAAGSGSGRAAGGSGNTAALGSSGNGSSNAGGGNSGFGATAGGGLAGSSSALAGTGGDLAMGGSGRVGSSSGGDGGHGGTFGDVGGAGSSGAGNASGGVGNTGNYGGRGSAGSAAEPGLPPCDSSTGQGCSDGAVCVDLQTADCEPDSHSSCNGYCETSLSPPTCAGDGDCPSGMRCLPSVEHVDERRCIGSETPACSTDDDCPDGFACREQTCVAFAASCNNVGSCENQLPAVCPPWYTRAATNLCAAPCVPVQECSCVRDADCPYPTSCDRIRGRCAVATQAPGCSLTYDAGPCDGNDETFAFVDGSCTGVRYGGCGGNANRFGTIEECMLRCEGQPLTTDCPDGRVAAHICLACADVGGCQTLGDFCAQTCEGDGNCTTVGQSCVNGVCQATGCD